MARFYGDLHGNRGQATRTGTAKSAMRGHIRGWNIGAYVQVYDCGGEDRIYVSLSGGSNNPSTKMDLGTYHVVNGQIEKC